MDRGRQIDNIQNVNAVHIDQFGRSGKTSTRVTHPPGGEDHFSLGWGYDPEPQPRNNYGKKRFDQPQPQQQQQWKNPSGPINRDQNFRSNIVFGNDDPHYDHYRK